MGVQSSRSTGLVRAAAGAGLTLLLLTALPVAGAFAADPGVTEEAAIGAAEREILDYTLYYPDDLELFECDARLESIPIGDFWVVSYTDISGKLRERVVVSAADGTLVTDKDVLQHFGAWDQYVSRQGAVGSWTWAIIGIVMSGVVGFGAYRWMRKPRLGWKSWLVNTALGSYATFVLGGVVVSLSISDTRGTLVCLLCVVLLGAGIGLGLKKRGRWGLVQIPDQGTAPVAAAAPEVAPAENTIGPSTAVDRGQMARARADEPSPLTVIPPEELPCFADVGGMEDVKRQLRESVGLLVSHNDLARQYRLDWNGVLLYGPPGVGKTFMAKAAAGEFGLNFVDIRVSDVLSSSFGGSAKLISAVFGEAKLRRPCILFFDEFDSIAQRREQALFDTENVRIVNQLLRDLEAARKVPDLIVMAASNFKDNLDEAVLRPGRFDRHIAIGMPDEAARRTIIQAQLARRPLASDIDIDELVRRTDSMSAADITAVVNTAALDALKQSAAGAAASGATAMPLGHEGLVGAIDALHEKVKPTLQFASWDDLVLDTKTLERLKEVQRFIEEFEDLKLRGIEMPRGVLLYGPPGTGKTTIARVLASQANASFYAANASELVSMWLGESEKLISRLFSEARKHRPSIIFIDEIDSLVARRSGGTWSDARTNQFLREIDGVTSTPGVFVIGATNLTSGLDPALLRGGRLSRQILIPLPDEGGRRRLFEVHARDMVLAKDVDFAGLARKTEKMSGADIRDVCQAAAMRAFARSAAEVDATDFAEALKQYIADRPEFDAPGWAPKLDSSEKPQKKIKIGFAPPTAEETAADSDPADPPAKG